MHPIRAARAPIWLALLLTIATTLAACGAGAEVGSNQTATPAIPQLPDDRGDATGDVPDDGSDGGTGSVPGEQSGEQPGGGGGNVVDPDQPVGGVPAPGDPQDPSGGALQVRPEPGIVNAIPHAWDHIDVAPDGRTITVYFWGGVQDCYGLASVDVERDANGLLQVTVLEGQRGNLPPNTACDDIALLKSVTITLDEGIFTPAD